MPAQCRRKSARVGRVTEHDGGCRSTLSATFRNATGTHGACPWVAPKRPQGLALDRLHPNGTYAFLTPERLRARTGYRLHPNGACAFLTPERLRARTGSRYRPNGAAHTSPGCNPGEWSMNRRRSEGTPHPGHAVGHSGGCGVPSERVACLLANPGFHPGLVCGAPLGHSGPTPRTPRRFACCNAAKSSEVSRSKTRTRDRA
jgi:hypothetical protein